MNCRLILTVVFFAFSTTHAYVDQILSICPPRTASAFIKDPTLVKNLKKIVVELENAGGSETSDTSDTKDSVWRLRATAPKMLPPVQPPSFLVENSPFNELEIFQLVRDGETRVDNVIFSPKKKKKITLIHNARSTGELRLGGIKKTYLELQSVVLSDVKSESKDDDEEPNIWRITKELEEGEGGGGPILIGDVKVEDLFGFNIPLPPVDLLADSTTFETTYQDSRLRITRGGNGLNAFGDFRVFERVVTDCEEEMVGGEGESDEDTTNEV